MHQEAGRSGAEENRAHRVRCLRLLLVRVATEKALPFEPLNPNAETVAAMKAARWGELDKFGKPDKLRQSLNAGDSGTVYSRDIATGERKQLLPGRAAREAQVTSSAPVPAIGRLP